MPTTPATHPLTGELPEFLRLPNMTANKTPTRIGLLLPFSNGSGKTRALANAMLKAAQLAVFDAHNPDVLLMTADEGSTPDSAVAGMHKLLDEGAEIVIGPLFAASVTAVAPLARDRGVPLVAFSTDRTVGGDGVYLLSFQPENEVRRVVDYAASQGAKTFAALVPQTAYGQRAEQAFDDEVKAVGGEVKDVEKYSAAGDAMNAPAAAIAKTGADAILIADGDVNLKTIAPLLEDDGVDRSHVHLLGTGLWDDPSLTKEPALQGAWFAAPMPYADDAFDTKYKNAFGTTPPRLATLAYDGISLAVLIGQTGEPYKRFTAQALMDPNGFAGVNGIFRFNPDGSSERGLAILGVDATGFTVVHPAPDTFQPKGS
ncbi:MAG: penicillin-binding protein activator [Proteobacteria bacterium]|nr:penicillin-binding protein activator [Pseudomonadota bacterium]